jgi:DNA mismatch repair protein MutL
VAKINVLPKEIYQLIAAGEVVERPSSVVKEMIENSLDAGAKNITLEIKNGGSTYIRITDDGCGIERDDVKKVFISHATSKIAKKDDLNSIGTLGFRGEAMASISAVAKVELLTKADGEDIGTRYEIAGGEEKAFDDAGCPNGTTIVVRDIFFNTPAITITLFINQSLNSAKLFFNLIPAHFDKNGSAMRTKANIRH